MTGHKHKLFEKLRHHGRHSSGDQCVDVRRRRVTLSLTLGLFGLCLGAVLYRLIVADALTAPAAPTAAVAAEQAAKRAADEKKAYWNQPEAGLLGGRVTGQDDAGFVLEDAKGLSWYISTTESTPGLENAQFLQSVRVKGEKREDGYFIAKEILPWEYEK